jgi:NADH:ubiquinone oxidoreductase subunit H
MAQHEQPIAASGSRRRPDAASGRQVVAEGVARLAGVLLSLVALLEVARGVAAIASNDIAPEGSAEVFGVDAAAGGWLHLVIGVLTLATGVAIVTGHIVGFLAGTGLAFLGAVMSFFFVPYYPAWSLITLALNVLVIWALCSLISHDRVASSS